MNNLLSEDAFIVGIEIIYENSDYLRIPISYIKDFSFSYNYQNTDGSTLENISKKIHGKFNNKTKKSVSISVLNSYFEELNKFSIKQIKNVCFGPLAEWNPSSENNKLGDTLRSRLKFKNIISVKVFYSKHSLTSKNNLQEMLKFKQAKSFTVYSPYKHDNRDGIEKFNKDNDLLQISILN